MGTSRAPIESPNRIIELAEASSRHRFLQFGAELGPFDAAPDRFDSGAKCGDGRFETGESPLALALPPFSSQLLAEFLASHRSLLPSAC